ncbi:MAG: GNAT family N-acetyltransferase [Myxococcota bacterium]
MEAPDARLVDEALAWAAPRAVYARVPLRREHTALLAALTRTGGVRHGERQEFRTPVADLPEEDPAERRLSWRPGALDDATVALLAETGTGGPNALTSPARAHLTAWLSSPTLTCDPASVLHVGAVDGRDVALVVAQRAGDGWSTCTWMGLVPAARGRGLGHAVHRHALAMLRAQGATLYHGGTSAENAPMMACFARQGCVPWRRFARWRWDPAA